MKKERKNAIVLSSGGLDSTTVMAIVKNKGYRIYPLSFDYGQRHKAELIAAFNVAMFFKTEEPTLLDISSAFKTIGGSALTDMSMEVEKERAVESMAKEIPSTYVPARNVIFLSYAVALAHVKNVRDIFIGVNVVDYSGYPDCRPEFINMFQWAINLGTKMGIECGTPDKFDDLTGRVEIGEPGITIHTPIIKMTKAQIIEVGTELGVDYSITHSCYDPVAFKTAKFKDMKKVSFYYACGKCDSCILRKRGFKRAGIEDPTKYYVEEDL